MLLVLFIHLGAFNTDFWNFNRLSRFALLTVTWFYVIYTLYSLDCKIT